MSNQPSNRSSQSTTRLFAKVLAAVTAAVAGFIVIANAVLASANTPDANTMSSGQLELRLGSSAWLDGNQNISETELHGNAETTSEGSVTALGGDIEARYNADLSVITPGTVGWLTVSQVDPLATLKAVYSVHAVDSAGKLGRRLTGLKPLGSGLRLPKMPVGVHHIAVIVHLALADQPTSGAMMKLGGLNLSDLQFSLQQIA
ncbi:MAG: hypothetical protein LBG70_02585 [Bifidobacteriaceae bacterium]|nr:hypothetical protein [Bifidobacteriaceae bacterium]